MPSDTQSALISKIAFWVGQIMSALPVLMLLMSGTMKLVNPPFLKDQLVHLQLDESLLLGLGIVEITCTIIYLVPRTAILGAILLTGYLGGAIATHVRIHEQLQLLTPLILGLLVWGGLYLRDPRLRKLLPLRR